MRQIPPTRISNYASVFCYASPELKSNREVVLQAVSHNGLELRTAAPELQADREVVIQAVRSCGGAIKYASTELQRDLEIQAIAGPRAFYY